MSNGQSPLLQCSDLGVKVKGFQLSRINFSMNRNDYLFILGPTGCGKTMLLETLAGLRKPSAGQIVLADKDITHSPPEERGFGFAYQDSLLYPFVNVKDNILFGARAKNRHTEIATLKRMGRLAEEMGIIHLLDRYPRYLSGGEKQRVSLARAILSNPPLLLLDEPLSALDPQSRYEMQELLRNVHLSEKLGIIHVTHDFNEALQLGNKVLVMNQGAILQQGIPDEIFQRPKSLFISRFLRNENIIAGKVENVDGQLWIKAEIGNWIIGPIARNGSATDCGSRVHLMFQASQLSVYCDDQSYSRRPNYWRAKIEKVTQHSTHVSLVCEGNGRWNAALSKKEWQQLGLGIGSQVTLSVDGQKPHLLQ